MVMKMSVEQPLWRALTGYRMLAVVYAVVVHIWTHRYLTHPVPGAVYLAFLACWTLGTRRRVSSAANCTRGFLIADLSIALAGIALSLYVDADGLVEPTVPSIWVSGSVLAFAVRGGWRWGAASAVVISAANLLEQHTFSLSVLHDVMLTSVASIGIGYVVEVARASERTLARALQIEAATRERERLARDIHDSVLQVLAMVQRRGTALGGEAAELGRMAGEQEVALRTLVTRRATPAGVDPDGAAPRNPDGVLPDGAADAGSGGGAAEAGGTVRTAERPRVRRKFGLPRQAPAPADERADAHVHGDGARAEGTGGEADGDGDEGGAADGAGAQDAGAGETCDLRTLLSPFAGSRVTFAEPGAPVVLRTRTARELAAAVSAALDNVRQHARGPSGAEAQAWILVEDDTDEVVVTVRDDGPGIPEGRLTDAEAEGRLGVAQSIRGRLRDLGGSAELISVQGQGTEVELRVPRPAPPARARVPGRRAWGRS